MIFVEKKWVFTNSALWAGLVIESPCLSVRLSVGLSVYSCHHKTVTSGGQKKFWFKGLSINLAWDDTTFFFSSYFNDFFHFQLFFLVFGEPAYYAWLFALYRRAALHCTALTGYRWYVDRCHVTPPPLCTLPVSVGLYIFSYVCSPYFVIFFFSLLFLLNFKFFRFFFKIIKVISWSN